MGPIILKRSMELGIISIHYKKFYTKRHCEGAFRDQSNLNHN